MLLHTTILWVQSLKSVQTADLIAKKEQNWLWINIISILRQEVDVSAATVNLSIMFVFHSIIEMIKFIDAIFSSCITTTVNRPTHSCLMQWCRCNVCTYQTKPIVKVKSLYLSIAIRLSTNLLRRYLNYWIQIPMERGSINTW